LKLKEIHVAAEVAQGRKKREIVEKKRVGNDA
jgi:hypothetical protein